MTRSTTFHCNIFEVYINYIQSEVFTLLGCCTENVDSLLPMFRDKTPGRSSRPPPDATDMLPGNDGIQQATSQKREDLN